MLRSLFLLAALTLGGAALADEDPPRVCISPSNIQSTEIVDDNVILFHMSGGKVRIWKNTLEAKCFGLWINGGFAYEVRGGQICAHQQRITVLHGGGAPCFLGDFTPYVEPPKDEPKQ